MIVHTLKMCTNDTGPEQSLETCVFWIGLINKRSMFTKQFDLT